MQWDRVTVVLNEQLVDDSQSLCTFFEKGL
jgi:hypothetical protein